MYYPVWYRFRDTLHQIEILKYNRFTSSNDETNPCTKAQAIVTGTVGAVTGAAGQVASKAGQACKAAGNAAIVVPMNAIVTKTGIKDQAEREFDFDQLRKCRMVHEVLGHPVATV